MGCLEQLAGGDSTAARSGTFRAMQRYGLIVADNGADMFITGTYDARWDLLNGAFGGLSANDLEIVTLGLQ